jgi:hypothetical protein
MGGNALSIGVGEAKIVWIGERRVQRAWQGGQGRRKTAQQDRICEEDNAQGQKAAPYP